ncbi:MAG: biotin--[acetyl-CoA-carboxylase] ligase [Acholeplasmatales bacterium]|nr:biotin--[acetyl-CoA-carboxylase] ligase [Acholeplasmatales bacterium]
MIIELDVIDSTNNYIRKNLDKLDNYSLVMAKHQTKGKGRITRSWYDDRNSLTSSMLIKDVKGDPKHLSLVASYAIFKALKEYDLDVKIKWPNDIFLNDKKLCGILIETIITDKVDAIIGFGINTNTKTFPESIVATSILLEKGIEIDNVKLSKRVCELIVEAYEKIDFSEVIKINKENSYLMGKKVRLNYYGDGIEGVVKDLDENGNIIIDTGIATVGVFSGELTLIKD